jgi:hypothetical protein
MHYNAGRAVTAKRGKPSPKEKRAHTTRHGAKLNQSGLASLVERLLFDAFVSAGCTELVEALLQAGATATIGTGLGRKRPLRCGD